MVNIIGKRVNIQPVGAAAPDNGIGSIIAGLGQKMFGDTLTPELKRAKLIELQDKNDLIAAGVKNIGADGLIADPRIGSISAAFGGMDMNNYLKGVGANAAFTGGVDAPRLQQSLAANGQFAGSPESQARTQAAQINIEQMKEGGRARTAEQGFQNNVVLKGIEEQNKLRLADANTEVAMVNGVPTIVRRADSIGMPSVVSSDQNKAVMQNKLLPDLPLERQQDYAFGAQSPGELGVASVGGQTVPAFARPGGFYAVQGNQPIEGKVDSFGKINPTTTDALKPASGDQSMLLNRRVAAKSASSAIDNLDKLLSAPDAGAAVGFIGKSASVFNDIRAQAEAASKLFTPGGLAADASVPGMSDAVDGAMTRLFSNQTFNAKAQQLGVQANVLRSQIVDLAYTIAKAKDPSGRMSNQDIDRASEILGGALMDPVAGRQVLGTVKAQIAEQHNIFEQEYERMYPGKGAQPNAAMPQGSAPPAQPPPGGVRRYNPTTGAIE